MPANTEQEQDDNCRLVIEGVRRDNKKFRPSDWVERIATLIASFGPDHRIRYSQYVHPCVLDDRRCLIVTKHLNARDPEFYDFIMRFARDNDLQVREDRREKSVAVADERRKEPQSLLNTEQNLALKPVTSR